MVIAKIGEDHYVGTDAVSQRCHLAPGRNAGLDDCESRGGFDLPQRQRHADTGVEAAGRTCHLLRLLHQLHEPFLERGFPPAAGNRENPSVKSGMARGYFLQSRHRVVYQDYVGILYSLHVSGDAGGHKVSYPRVVKGAHIEVAVVSAGCGYGEEERCRGGGKGTGVCEKGVDRVVLPPREAFPAED